MASPMDQVMRLLAKRVRRPPLNAGMTPEPEKRPLVR
jgi:hypothetical protein